MIVDRKDRSGPIEIDLAGPEGNSFNLLGFAHRLANMLDLDYEPIMEEMKAGDYEHLLETMEKYFGDHIIMYRS